jgi:hypothetical protein
MNRKLQETVKKSKSIKSITVREFELANKIELRTENKDMKLTEYYEKKGFPEFSKLLTA